MAAKGLFLLDLGFAAMIMLFASTPLRAFAVCPSCHNEWDILEVIAEILPKNPLIIQGGYYENATSKMSYLWPNGRIYIFEANPKHFEMLKEDRHLPYLNAEIFPYALDEAAGLLPFYISTNGTNPWMGSLLPAASQWNWYYTDDTQITVECKNLQEWAHAKNVQAVDFIWLNIGGAELRVLKSMPELIETVKVVLVETHDREFRQGMGLFDEVRSFLEQYDVKLIHQWMIPNYQGYSLFMKQGLVEVTR